MNRRMFRYEVPVDDRKHVLELTSGPLHVATVIGAGGEHRVEFWAEVEEGQPTYPRAYQVFGTGQPLPDEAAWVGTCDRTPAAPGWDGLVWHLYEVAP